MAGKNIIMATQEELKRFHVVQKILEGSLKQDETLRNWLIKEGALGKGAQKEGSPATAERKGRFGEMLQVDGSHHDWLEGRGSEIVLMGSIDDA
ncbi:MAG: hypothetical protein A3H37_12090 [Candidatus Schekmanbacteria bacterium RIFCSPLOWO2_02_FULL_38_14]|uniref:Uncharacterized protein n=1 Tax=Candidatus Schekmanbacteria bacterium RIFCSPLOWO2_12_FULL_38_15 TaxID=1817883 RepID=A0A1F7SM03_9BACT|nr:MAG: hypothetical protein A3H37_12090 [Candidatus Schekmanbacteria bacterium RIFCSPLOWO2_02_FULL_38_14]OGL54811.1 MAG: hypothetical protein A3G31_01710 [Candidatus Schekmanbacteria bacterium RIFCSPLOWO2_12_FULL_38_15]